MQVGDFAWAWRRKRSGVRGTAIDAGAQNEMLLLDCVVERKNVDKDIVPSVQVWLDRRRSLWMWQAGASRGWRRRGGLSGAFKKGSITVCGSRACYS